jgi:transcriptional regulator with XRE-family HTH domain
MRQEDLADAVGLGRSTIDALENGRSEKPEDIQLLKVFARVLKVSQIEILVAAELLDESEAQPFRPTAAVDQILQALDEVRGEVQVLRKEIHPDQGQ